MRERIAKIWRYQESQPLNEHYLKKLNKKFLPINQRIYDPEFLNKIRQNPQSIVFDLDGTLLIMSKETEKTYLRLSLYRTLKKLKSQKNIRLVLWSAAVQDYVKSKLEQYPELIDQFDEIITAENYRINPEIFSKEDSILEEKNLKKFLKEVQQEAIEKNEEELKDFATILKRALKFRKKFDEGKNLALVNYLLLIDNAPGVRTQAILGGHYSIHLPTIDWNYITPVNLPRIIKFEKILTQIFQVINNLVNEPENSKIYIKNYQNKINRFTKPTKTFGKIFFSRKYV